MTNVPISYQVPLGPASSAEIERAIGQHSTLEQVLNWCQARQPPQWVADIVTQDEFTLDVIVRFDADRYLVYDTT